MERKSNTKISEMDSMLDFVASLAVFTVSVQNDSANAESNLSASVTSSKFNSEV